jgi:ABC-type sugar transport system ATPase subunit
VSTDTVPAVETATGTTALVRITGLAKSFGATQALRKASFDLRPGEVHVLAGENGSGKSTLVKILSGVHAPGGGTIELAGERVASLRTPRDAQDHGIVTVLQEVLVVEARSVLENTWLGVDALLRTRVPESEKRRLAGEALTKLLGRALDLDTPIEELSLSDRQACCIVRALLRRPRVLILDEATSALDIATRDRLFALINELRSDDVGTIFITHRMDEITEIGDRITVLRSGTTVGTLERGRWKASDLVHLMTGADQLTEHARESAAPRAERSGGAVLSVNGLVLADGRKPFDVTIRAGELVGVAGLEGHGQNAFLEALRGVPPVAGNVVHHDDGATESPLRSPFQAADLGIAYVPRERRHAMFGWMSIRENFGMPTLRADSRVGWLRTRSTRKRLAKYIDDLNIVLGKQDDRITTLSGGNQQKIVIARWLASEPQVLLLNDPTRGIDIGAKRDLYRLLTRLADEGMAIVTLSTELDEHIELMDRVLVFREQELFRELPRAAVSRTALVAAFFGEQVDDGEHAA